MKREKMLKILRIVPSVLFWAFFCVVLTFSIISYVRKDDRIDIFGKSFVRIMSGSMENCIKTGSLIINDSVPPAEEIQEGDIITYRLAVSTKRNILITHRVVEVKTQGDGTVYFITQGDAVPYRDYDPVSYNSVVGVYSGTSIPVLGFVISFVTSVQGLLTIATIYIVFAGTSWACKKIDKLPD